MRSDLAPLAALLAGLSGCPAPAPRGDGGAPADLGAPAADLGGAFVFSVEVRRIVGLLRDGPPSRMPIAQLRP